jgi:hypothetical protein
LARVQCGEQVINRRVARHCRLARRAVWQGCTNVSCKCRSNA